MKTIVVLGAGWTGLPIAHKLLKYTAPKTPIKVILVSPNTHFYWNIAATRGVVPDGFSDDQLFRPIAQAFDQYKTGSFEFVLGRATNLDPGASTVELELNDAGGQRTVAYDQLVIATGSSVSSGLPLKALGRHEDTKKALHDLQESIGRAQTIVVAGGGLTGVETAGEIAARYGTQKTVTLVDSASSLLKSANALPSVAKAAESSLRSLGVQVVYNARVVSPTADAPEAGSTGSPTAVVLSTGETIMADLFLPLFGIRLNNEFVPKALLDDHGNLKLDRKMRVTDTQNVWGLGDMGNLEPKQLFFTEAQIHYVAKMLDAVLTGGDTTKLGEYKPNEKVGMVAAMGKKHAVGQLGKWKLPGFLLSWVKGKALFTDSLAAYVDGKKLLNSAL